MPGVGGGVLSNEKNLLIYFNVLFEASLGDFFKSDVFKRMVPCYCIVNNLDD